jgi:hypothetical protein
MTESNTSTVKGRTKSDPCSPTARLTIARNTTYEGFGRAAGAIVDGQFELKGCTIVDNRSSADPVLFLMFVTGTINRCVFAFNRGKMYRADDATVTMACSDVFGNTRGSGFNGTDLGGNFSADPLFCDLEGGDYTLNADSPCLSGQHPDGADCGLIGAFGEGCGGSTPILETTWGSLKNLYR